MEDEELEYSYNNVFSESSSSSSEYDSDFDEDDYNQYDESVRICAKDKELLNQYTLENIYNPSLDSYLNSKGYTWKPCMENVENRKFDTNKKASFKNLNASSPMLEFFKGFLFSENFLKDIVKHTNSQLQMTYQKGTNEREIMILISLFIRGIPRGEKLLQMLFEGGLTSRQNLSIYRFMSKSRFDTLVGCLRFSDPRLDDTSFAEFNNITNVQEVVFRGWNDLDALVEAFNESRKSVIEPSARLCVGNASLKFRRYVPKYPDQFIPEPGTHVPLSITLSGVIDCDTGIVLALSVDQKDIRKLPWIETNCRNTARIMELTKPWANSGRTVYGDTGSVETAHQMLTKNRLHFVAEARSRDHAFPFDYFSKQRKILPKLYYNNRRRTLRCTCFPNSEEFLYAIDNTQQGNCINTCISSCGTSGSIPDSVEDLASNYDIVSEYYLYANTMKRHRENRESYFTMEDLIKTGNWSVRIFCTILEICVVDAHEAYTRLVDSKATLTDFTWALTDTIFEDSETTPSKKTPAQAQSSQNRSSNPRKKPRLSNKKNVAMNLE